MKMIEPDTIASSSILAPQNEWNNVNLDMNQNDFDVLKHEVFEVTSSDFFEMEFDSNMQTEDKDDILHLIQNELDEEMSIDVDLIHQSTDTEEHPENTSPTSTSNHWIEYPNNTRNDVTGTDVSLHLAQLPFLTSAELEDRMDQAVSRLALSMKRSEMSRQRYLDNGGGYCSTSIFSNFIGNSPANIAASESRKAVGSFISRVGSNAL